MGKPDPAKVARLKPKKKCCKKKTRCLRCPVVVHRMQKLDLEHMSKKDARKALKQARKNPARVAR
ncbi:MAG: hypothetical protein WAW85_11240 [Gordonia sp. (in: high G+C Gram-positive bacteria)]|uniref:hypothetical protein n=1 Tax=Gordonia sp. (in: high G+C Gram-positive bacteria) TaxID=84139 RepID=UPI003BB765C9